MSILFLGGICGFFGGRGAPASGGGLPSLSPAAPTFRLLFCPYPPVPLPSGKGETKVILCKGLRPLHPRAEPGLNGNRKGAPVPSGGFPSLSPAAPAFRLLFCPLSPRPRSQSDLPRWGRGRPRLFYARGFAPCIPGLNPRGTGSTCRCRRLNGGGVPPALLARRALAVHGGWFAFFVARRPRL